MSGADFLHYMILGFNIIFLSAGVIMILAALAGWIANRWRDWKAQREYDRVIREALKKARGKNR